jgi:ABC-2 type transport system permease protein
MKRYFKLWWSFFRISSMADMEYRLNVVVRVIGEFSWYTVQLSVFEVLYLHTNSISGWTLNDMRVFMGTLFLTDVLFMVLFMENLENMSSLVKKGDLDTYLTKPIDSQFMVSCRKVSIAYLINLVLISAYLVWAITKLPGPITFYQIVCYLALVFFGLIIYYALRFTFGILTILLHDAGNIQFIWHQFFRLGTRPDPIYPRMMRIFVLVLLPVAFFASVPARILVEGIDWRLLVSSPVLAIGLLFLSHFLWNKALRLYSSASS